MRGIKKKPLTDEHKKKISEGVKRHGVVTHPKKVLWVNKGIVFDSMSEAAEASGISISGVSRVCRGVRKHTFNQQFQYAEKEN